MRYQDPTRHGSESPTFSIDPPANPSFPVRTLLKQDPWSSGGPDDDAQRQNQSRVLTRGLLLCDTLHPLCRQVKHSEVTKTVGEAEISGSPGARRSDAAPANLSGPGASVEA